MVLQPRRVLWPTDFSKLSLHGGRYANAFRRAFNSQLHVVYVIPPATAPEVPATIPPEVPILPTDPSVLDAGRSHLQKLVQEVFGDADNVVCEAFFGNPWSAICDYAKRLDIDLIVVATHGRTGLLHALIGSTAERIVQHAPCPVLTVKDKERDFIGE